MPAPDPAALMAALHQRRDALLAQCAPPASTPRLAGAADRSINVIELGSEGPSVLVVHGGVQGGLGGGPDTFDRQKPLADAGWRLRLVERPGFGRSPSRGVDDMEADAEWIADMLGDGAHLVGHSWGGAEALLAAGRRPEAVRSLTLIEPALFPIVMTDPDLRADPQMQGVAGRLSQLMMQSDSPAAYAVAFARSVLGPTDDPETAARIAALEADPDLAGRVGCAVLQSRMATGETLRAAADRVAEAGTPVLVVSGGWTPFFDLVNPVVARFTGGDAVTVPSANHMVMSAAAEPFNAALVDFMTRADARRPTSSTH